MLRAALKVAVATGLYAAVHSALASSAAKRAAARWLGDDRRNALYRPFYITQSLATFGALAAYIARLPGSTLYDIRGPARLALRTGQASGVAWAAWAAWEVGLGGITGARGLVAWARGREVPPEPAAQGPALADGGVQATGPFAFSRHPLNLAPLPIFLLQPRMTTRWAAFTAVSALYLVLGSIHEEKRLRQAYGAAYDRYRAAGPPFYLPRPR